LFYATRDSFYAIGTADQIRRIDDRTAQLRTELWAAIQPLLLVLPLVVSISFFLIADIDSPRAGIITPIRKTS
jgi:hypothetical protein